MYKPMFKVAHKTVTELEWRCCPGYSGYGCMEGPPAYQHPMKMMPPFKGPPFKGPQFKGPQYKGPMSKGPMFKGPPMVKANPWSQPEGPPSYPMHHFGPPRSPSYPDPSFETYPSEPEPVPEPELEPEPMPDHQEPHHSEHEQEHEHELEHGQGPEEHVPEETPPPSGGERAENENIGVYYFHAMY